MKNDKFLGVDDNFEVESLKIKTGMKPEMTIADLSDAEKSEFFDEKIELTFELVNAIEMTR